MKDQDKIKEIKTFIYSNAKIRVHIPDLTKEEREKRVNRVKTVAKSLLKTK